MNEKEFISRPEKIYSSEIIPENMSLLMKEIRSQMTDLEIGGKKPEDPNEDYEKLSEFIRILSALKKFNSQVVPETWVEVMGSDNYETEQIPTIKNFADGERKLDYGLVPNPRLFARQAGLTNEDPISEEDEAATEETDEQEEISDTMKMIRERMPKGEQSVYTQQTTQEKTQSRDPSNQEKVDRFKNASFGNTKPKKKGWFR